ncbi:MAG: hypothetical protein ABSC54_08450 [Smithellaceae bacterium]
MKLETKLLNFYLGLEERDRVRFRSLLGPTVFRKIVSPMSMEEAVQSLHAIDRENPNISSNRENYDIAIMQLVRHLVKSAPSNVELARSIEGVIDETVSRAAKRSKYELQGKLLEALMKADRNKLLMLRNKIMNTRMLARTTDSESNLEKWFSIILGDARRER